MDARTDIFSFGVVLYELLAGRRPFAAHSTTEELHRIIHRSPEPLNEEVPLPLRTIVEKALRKDPAERYQTMRQRSLILAKILSDRENPRYSVSFSPFLPRALPGRSSEIQTKACHENSRSGR